MMILAYFPAFVKSLVKNKGHESISQLSWFKPAPGQRVNLLVGGLDLPLVEFLFGGDGGGGHFLKCCTETLAQPRQIEPYPQFSLLSPL